MVLYEVVTHITAPLFFDCSLFYVGDELSNVRFGLLNKVADLETGQASPGMATETGFIFDATGVSYIDPAVIG